MKGGDFLTFRDYGVKFYFPHYVVKWGKILSSKRGEGE
jgi:hypothetical protein